MMTRHLAIKAWCPCKDAKWTIEDAVRGQTDGRSTRFPMKPKPERPQTKPLANLVCVSSACKLAGVSFNTFLRHPSTRALVQKLQEDLSHVALKFDGRSVWACAEVARHLDWWIDNHKQHEAGYVYAVTSTDIDYVKIGMWRGDVTRLLDRYATYFSGSIELVFAPTVGSCRLAEKTLMQEFHEWHLERELFSKQCWEGLVRAVWEIRQAALSIA